MNTFLLIVAGVCLLALGISMMAAFAARSSGGATDEPDRRGDFRRGTTYEEPQDEGTSRTSRPQDPPAR